MAFFSRGRRGELQMATSWTWSNCCYTEVPLTAFVMFMKYTLDYVFSHVSLQLLTTLARRYVSTAVESISQYLHLWDSTDCIYRFLEALFHHCVKIAYLNAGYEQQLMLTWYEYIDKLRRYFWYNNFCYHLFLMFHLLTPQLKYHQ